MKKLNRTANIQESINDLNDIDIDLNFIPVIDIEQALKDLNEFSEDLITAQIEFNKLCVEQEKERANTLNEFQALIAQDKTACDMDLFGIVENTANGEDGKTEIIKKEGVQ